MKVERFMRKSATISPKTPICEAEALCRELGVKILAVAEHGRLAGVVTRGDLARALPSEATTLAKNEMRSWLDEVRVDEFMKKPIAVSTDMDIFDAAALAAREGFYNFPVVKDSAFVGMLYEADLFRCLVEEVSRPSLRVEVNMPEGPQNRLSILKRLGIGGMP